MTFMTRRQFSKTMAGTAAAMAAPGLCGSLVRALDSKAGSIDQIAGLTLTEAVAKIRSRAVTSVQLTQACLERIRIYNPKVDAFITVLGQQALAQAAQLDLEAKADKFRGPLHGIPIALKDNIDTAGIRTTAASQVYDDRVPTEDAEVTRRLAAAGAVCVGKANLDEFADAVSYFGSARNPWALDRDPSGSSSGGVGIKPTYGLVPIRGIVPLAVSLDHCGPITRSVGDAALMLNQLAGYDKLDITSIEHPKEDYVAAMAQPVSGFRLGIPRAPFYDHLDDDTAKAVEIAIGVLTKMTKSTKDVSLPSTGAYSWMDLNSIGEEVYAYHEDLLKAREPRYGLSMRLQLQEMRDGLDSPASACSSKVSNYIRHRWDLTLLRRTVDDAFSDFDLVVMPTLRIMPLKLSYVIERQEHPKAHNPEPLDLDNCTPFNVYGLPAISVPCGFSRDGLPVGLMIAGPHFSEGKVLALARTYELETKWDLRHPPLTADTPVPAIRPA